MSMLATHHIGITVADLDAAGSRWTAAGFQMAAAFEVDSDEAARANGLDALHMMVRFLVRPPLTVEILEHKLPGRAQQRTAGQAGYAEYEIRGERDSAHHALALVVRDVDCSGELYGQLGLARRGAPDCGQGVTFVHDDLELTLTEATDREAPSPQPNDLGNVHLAFSVEGIDHVCARLAGRGVQVLSAPQREPGGPAWCFVRDPGGGPNVELIEW